MIQRDFRHGSSSKVENKGQGVEIYIARTKDEKVPYIFSLTIGQRVVAHDGGRFMNVKFVFVVIKRP